MIGTTSHKEIRKALQAFAIKQLLIEVLGWDHARGTVSIDVENQTYRLQAVAQKKGLIVYECTSGQGQIPPSAVRARIDRELTKTTYEHLIVFVDASHHAQLWQWVRREPGRPLARREHRYNVAQRGDALIQKLQSLAFSLEEEESLAIPDAAARTRMAFDVERVTRRFFDVFQEEHRRFLGFIQGITDGEPKSWYCSVMLNRLMFVYFLQKKGFLDGDTDYLRKRLRRMTELRGGGHFLSFYRYFLLRLFHEGLGKESRTTALEVLLGVVPYLNGGLFEVHELEAQYPDLDIPDDAFEGIFDFFDRYQWHLDERQLQADNEINPDVLGYIFEKYINQKQMGAYYTKEDITIHISATTVVPYLVDKAEELCAIALTDDSSAWDHLRTNPDRYIPSVLSGGVDIPADSTAFRVDLGDTRLPTETDHEQRRRTQRYQHLRDHLASGAVKTINQAVILNLDVRQIAQDVIENSEGPELVRAFYRALGEITILDPACGSGAFLFAALRVLEPLLDACLGRMAALVEDDDLLSGREAGEHLSDFRRILAEVAAHPSARYYILKSIIINNLFGVDVMPEAVEICKLRLFLKLVAQVEPDGAKPNLGLEALPDIDFNIRAGNSLVGFTNLAQVQAAAGKAGSGQGQLFIDKVIEDVDAKAEVVAKVSARFRALQVTERLDSEGVGNVKHELRTRLTELREVLDRYVCQEYLGAAASNEDRFQQWRRSHEPFHWLVEFHSIMEQGGFAVTVGNPPWKEYSTVRRSYTVRGYATEPCGNLYALFTERALQLRKPDGRLSFIVQLPLMSSSRMAVLRKVMSKGSDLLLVTPFDDRPGKLFDGLQHCRSVIFNSFKAELTDTTGELWTAQYQRWPTEGAALPLRST